jgi:sugar lactone lactonase YvrE
VAVGPDGDLYLADDALDQILERQPNGNFVVIAGNGTVGFSGDGGPAVDAQLSRPRGMAFAPDGTLYIADAGNGRVRAVTPDGTITTVAGDGQAAGGPGDTPLVGQSATATGIGTAQAVTVSPTGALVIATANALVELDGSGTLALVAGPQNFLNIDPRYPGVSECDPDGVAFDGSGDLWLSCSNWHDILDRSPDGRLTYRGPLRPHDADAALSSGPGGSVLALWQSSLERFTATGPPQVTTFDTVAGVGDFWPQGVAAAPDGTIYLDQDGISGIGPPAIIEEAPGGRPAALWTHPAGSSPS